jgi:Lipocalin-like domain
LTSASQTINGQTHDYFGPHPLGQIIFTPNGRFAVILLRSDLPKFASNNRSTGTLDENSAVVRGSVALFGTYTYSGNTLHILIDGSSFPNWRGKDQARMVKVTGDELTWQNAAASGGGGDKLVYQRTTQQTARSVN